MVYPEGIDISVHNGTPNLNGLAFVFVRACYGTMKDPKYDQHAKAVRDAGLVLGAYCFGRNMTPTGQADRLLEIASDADLLCLDWEADEGHAKMTRQQARDFIKRIHPHAPTVLYASESGYPADQFGADLRWVDNWSHKPTIAWDFWQYSHKPTIAWDFWPYWGTTLDRDRYNGTLEQLHALVGWPTEEAADPMTATSTHYRVADGDYGVYVPRNAAVVRTADKNVGV